MCRGEEEGYLVDGMVGMGGGVDEKLNGSGAVGGVAAKRRRRWCGWVPEMSPRNVNRRWRVAGGKGGWVVGGGGGGAKLREYGGLAGMNVLIPFIWP